MDSPHIFFWGGGLMFFGINNVFHFSTDGNDFNSVKNNNDKYSFGKVETVNVLSQENRVLILTRDSLGIDYLYGFDLDGNLKFKVGPPEHYSFWYLSKKQIVCNGADNFAKKAPLSGWWFSINLDTGNLTMGSPVY